MLDQLAGQENRRSGVSRDLTLALVLAAFLTLMWAARDWNALSRLVLPDNDDLMRLAQVRDWLAGQATNDWTQYRVSAPDGAPMHWSRVNDVGIAGLILAFSPLVGRHAAEVIAVVSYPALLFAAHLFMSARIARGIWGAPAAAIAIVLAALAIPGTTIFVPGRIDHHALQVVLLDAAILGSIARPNVLSGLASGVALALALAIGLETVPHIAALLIVLFSFWVLRGAAERDRLIGLAIGLAATTLPFVLFLRPTLWTPIYCDAFTSASTTATFLGAAALALLAALTSRLPDWRKRLMVGGIIGAATFGIIVVAFPTCLSGPYGEVDPFLQREFMAHIEEATGIFSQAPFGRAVQMGGLMFAAVGGVVWIAQRRTALWQRWLPLAAVIVVSGVITLAQVRGTYVGTPLSAPLLAGIILAVRNRRPQRPFLVISAWLTLSGMGWYAAPILVETIAASIRTPIKASLTSTRPPQLCTTPETWAAVGRYPPGIVMAPISSAAFFIGATDMSTVAAGYHRANRGTLAMYRFFLSPPDRAAQIARAWRVRYVAFCPGDFEEIDVARRFPNSVATLLNAGRTPQDFTPLPLQGTRLRLYRLPSR